MTEDHNIRQLAPNKVRRISGKSQISFMVSDYIGRNASIKLSGGSAKLPVESFQDSSSHPLSVLRLLVVVKSQS